MNKVVLVGRLTKDVDVKYTQSASGSFCIANFTLAVNRKFAKQDQQQADFVNVRALGKLAEFAEKWIGKGLMVCIAGELHIENYEDKKTKEKKQYTYVLANEIDPVEWRKDGKTARESEKEDEDDLPF